MQGMGIGAGLAAIGFWGFVAIVVVAGIWFYVRKRESEQETLRLMMQSGQAIDQELMSKILSASGAKDHLDRDLRISGLIMLFIAPGLALLGWFVSQQTAAALLPLLGVAALILCIAVGLLVAAKSAGDQENRPSG
ncbi:MAG TPA: DUF6249 domain-containing protein [Alphaproteobacteria bacterium]|nr:DUF6249 domain-containing protein [Alphaproteobacteria bacterium]HJM49325.1 DUF6249 domain-containing protein [Alphaproteobacteria bacterium]